MSRTNSNLTRSQLLVWLGQQQFPDTPIYNMAITFEITAALDATLFQRAFQGFVDDCDALRSVFEGHADQPCRRVLERMDFKFEQIDFSDHDDPESACRAWLKQRRAATIDLARCPFDTALLRLAPDRFTWYLNQHHIITDVHSVSLIFAATAKRYQALRTDAGNPESPNGPETSVHPPERLPLFEDYAAYENRLESEGRIENARSHWRQRAELWRALDQPYFYGYTQRHTTTESDRVEIKLGPARRNALRTLAAGRQLGTLTPEMTLFQVLLTTLFAYLYRITGERILVIGAPSANRTNIRQRETVGLFMQVFSLSVEIEAGETFDSLHRKVQAESLNFLRYAAPGAASPESARAFNVVLNYARVGFPSLNSTPVKQRFYHAGHGEPHHLLRLQVQDFEHSGELLLEMDLNRGAFGETPGLAAAEHFISVLDAFLAHRGTRLDNYDLVPLEERALLTEKLNRTATPYSCAKPLHKLFEAAAEAHPKRVAVVSEQIALGYLELNRHASRLAVKLIQAGVRCSDIVGLRLEQGAEMIIAMLGVLKAGAAYMPIVGDIPPARRDYMLNLGNVSVIVCSDALLDEMQCKGRFCLSVNGSGDSTGCSSTQSQTTPALFESPAYLLFTSGSTGDPKGVLCRHRGVVNLLEAFEQLNHLPEEANCAWWTSASFDVSVYEIFSALAFGRTLHIVPERVRAGGGLFFAWLSENRIQSAYAPPFMLNEIWRLLEKGEPAPPLVRLLVGVEPIPEETLAGIAAALPGLQIINGYGPTEATICTTLYSLPKGPAPHRNTPIGRPVRNTSLYLLDGARRLVPFGAVGEIYVGGDGLASGYLNRPDLTAAGFVADPFDSGPEAWLYKTGDLARYLPNGDLIYLGRVDDQIKLRGQRIEPGEIEGALLGHPAVRDALVVAEQSNQGKRLVAYLVANRAGRMPASEWSRWLAARLPRFMIPGAYVMLDVFPLTASGKIDRSALPPPEDCGDPILGSRPPETPLERELAGIFKDIMELPEIDVEAHFIELGGDSIRAMQIAARANEAGVALSPRQIFEAGTIAALALELQDSQPSRQITEPGATRPVSAREMEDVLAEFGDDLDNGCD